MLTKRTPPVGSRPGTLFIPPDSQPPRIRLVEYDAESLVEREVRSPEELTPHARTDETTWIDIQGLGDAQVLERIGEIFGIHRLALEDAVNVPQRAKSEIYAEHHVVVARGPLLDGDDLEVPQVCLVIGRQYLITFQDRYFGFFDPVRERLRAGNGPIRGGGPGYLAYALLDTLTDHFYPVVERTSERLDDLEEVVLDDPATEELADIHRLRRTIATLRRVGWPQRDMLVRLVEHESPFLDAETRTYLRDTLEHMGQVMGRVDFCREVSMGLMDTAISMLGHRQNEIMKVLTLMASIFIPLTFIAGIYGMNFENMPELHHPRGYFTVLGLMVVLAVALVWYFRRRGWLGRGGRR